MEKTSSPLIDLMSGNIYWDYERIAIATCELTTAASFPCKIHSIVDVVVLQVQAESGM